MPILVKPIRLLSTRYFGSLVGACLLSFGIVIVAAQVFDGLTMARREQLAQKTGIAGYDHRTRSLAEFKQQKSEFQNWFRKDQAEVSATTSNQPLRTETGWGIVVRLTKLVHQTLRHDDSNRIRFGENWIQWLAGKFYSPLNVPQLPDQILERQAGICSDACLVLQSTLKENNVPSRFVGISGHVLLEVQMGKNWRTLDPDFGVTSDFSVERLASDAATNGAAWLRLERNLKARSYSEQQIQNYRRVLVSTDDNQTMPINQPLSPRLYQFAEITDWLSPISSILLCVLGSLILWTSIRRRTATENATE